MTLVVFTPELRELSPAFTPTFYYKIPNDPRDEDAGLLRATQKSTRDGNFHLLIKQDVREVCNVHA